MDTDLSQKEVYDLFPLDGIWDHSSSSPSNSVKVSRRYTVVDVN